METYYAKHYGPFMVFTLIDVSLVYVLVLVINTEQQKKYNF